MKHIKKDRTVYDIEKIHCGDEILYKVKNLTTNQEEAKESIDDYICCETPEDRMIIEVSELEDKIFNYLLSLIQRNSILYLLNINLY